MLVERFFGSKSEAEQSQLKACVLGDLFLLCCLPEEAEHKFRRLYVKYTYFLISLEYLLREEVQKLEVAELQSQNVELLSLDEQFDRS